MSSRDASRKASETSGTRVLVLASTLPSSPTDPVPAFVSDQVVALAQAHPELEFHILAPHDRRSNTRDLTRHDWYTEHRFHYFWPRAAEQLAGRGIMPALRENPLLYAVIPFLFLGEYLAAKRLTKQLRPALLYAHWFTPQAIVASWINRRDGLPFVFTTHASDVSVWHKIPLFGPLLVRAVTSRASAITAVSTRSRDKLLAFLNADSDAPPLEVIPMGTHSLNESTVRRERIAAETDDELVMLFIGRLVEKKGYEYLVAALDSIRDRVGRWRLIVAGEGPLREEWEGLTRETGLAEFVEFRGFVSGERKAACFAESDLLIVPSIVTADGDAEGLPVALLEGLAAGLLCVATNESGGDDIIQHGVNGLLCSQKDVAELAATILAAYELTPDERHTMSTAARELAASFNWHEIARRHYDFLIRPLLRVRS